MPMIIFDTTAPTTPDMAKVSQALMHIPEVPILLPPFVVDVNMADNNSVGDDFPLKGSIEDDIALEGPTQCPISPIVELYSNGASANFGVARGDVVHSASTAATSHLLVKMAQVGSIIPGC